MNRITVSDETLTKLMGLKGSLEICDESGNTLGFFQPARESLAMQISAESPLTLKELEQRRRDKTGRPLTEILRDMEGS